MRGSRRLKIVFLSHTYMGGDFVVGSHHLARSLAARGHAVAHVSTPLSWMHIALGRGHGRRQELARHGPKLVDGVFELVPRAPLPAQIHPTRKTAAHLRKIGFSDVDLLIVDQPLLWEGSLRKMASCVVYRPTDIYEGSVARRQHRVVEVCDRIVATSEAVGGSLGGDSDIPRMVLRNGVEFDRFRRGSGSETARDVLYVGAVDHRFDLQLLKDLAMREPELTFTLAGPVAKDLVGNCPSNLICPGAVPYHEVPHLMRQHRVGLLPFKFTRENEGRSPMKLFEYLASGLYVVGSRTSTLAQSGTPADGLRLYSTLEEAHAALRLSLGATGRNEAGIARAAREDWSVKADQLLEFCLSGQR